MLEEKIKDRLSFLAEKFDIFENDEIIIGERIKDLESKQANYRLIRNDESSRIDSKTILAIVVTHDNVEKMDRSTKTVSINMDVFSAMIISDPTPNKSCVQWMLNIFSRYLKEGNKEGINNALRFVIEDLPQASEYISLFEANKRKQKFKNLCGSSYVLKNMLDPTDINQYKSLSQLFDAVDPFIERKASEMESLLMRYVTSNQAVIPVKDRKFTLYIPKTLDASVIFEKYANWCTARPNNTNFSSYTNQKTPNGSKSDLYIIINNKFFTGESEDIYQIHFESNQIKDRKNSNNVSIFENVISESEGLSNFFYEELISMAKSTKGNIEDNKYLDYLVKFGFCESVFELYEPETPIIRLMNREIPKLPDISKFKHMDQLIICDAKLVEIHPSIGKLTNLEMLVLSQNRIKNLPKEIGNLKNVTFLNLIGNRIEDFPEEIKYLDKSNGGSLFRLAIKEDDIGKENYRKLRKLLPSTKF